MTLTQLQNLNVAYQKQAEQVAELFPGLLGGMTAIIRSAKRIDERFKLLISAKSEIQFHNLMNKIEEEMDEIIFILDRLDEANTERKITKISDFLMEGYELLSVYSKCCDIVIGKRVVKEDE